MKISSVMFGVVFAGLAFLGVWGCGPEATSDELNGFEWVTEWEKADGDMPSGVDVASTHGVHITPEQILSGRVLTLNEESFGHKINVIQSAQAGDSLDLIYYSFADDESSSFMARELMAAAGRGVSVRLILDYFTNIKNYWYFKAMREAGVQLKFYNHPPQRIREFFRYLLTPCLQEDEYIANSECVRSRKMAMSGETSRLAEKLFLTGVYLQDGKLMAGAGADVIGQYGQFDQIPPDRDDLRAAAEKALSMLQSQGEPKAAMASMIGMMLDSYLDPAQNVYQTLFPDDEGLEEFMRQWLHWTDFIHQKLLHHTGNGFNQVVLGGRNVENAYHLSGFPPEDKRVGAWKPKYTFMDADLWAIYTPDNSRMTIQDRFNSLWDAEAITLSIDADDLFVDVGILGKKDLFVAVDGESEMDAAKRHMDEAAARFLTKFASQPSVLRFVPTPAAGEDWDKSYRVYSSQMKSDYFYGVDFTKQEGSGLYYVENIPNPDGPDGPRVYGTEGKWGHEAESGKYIHALWLGELSRVCHEPAGSNNQVILQNAYLLMPTRLQRAIYAVANDVACTGMDRNWGSVKIITNSAESTDLAIINAFNGNYIRPLLRERTLLEYFEYVTDAGHLNDQTNPTARSLHAKVMIFGKNMWIGSSNLDGRSLFMDANNGMFIKGAPSVTEQYVEYINNTVLGLKLAVKDPSNLAAEKDVSDWWQMVTGFFGAEPKERLAQIGKLVLSQLYQLANHAMKADLDAKVFDIPQVGALELTTPNQQDAKEIMRLVDMMLMLL